MTDKSSGVPALLVVSAAIVGLVVIAKTTGGGSEGPDIDFSFTVTGLSVSFTSSISGEVTDGGWDFGDGNISVAEHPIHTYENPGTYKVTLTAVGPNGTSVKEKTVVVENTVLPPIACFDYTIDGLEVAFTNGSTGEINMYEWDFGDGNTSSDKNPVHVYNEAGTYDVYLTVSGPGGIDTTDYTVTIEEPIDSVVLTLTGPENKPQSFWGYRVYDSVGEKELSAHYATMDTEENTIDVESTEFLLISDYNPTWPLGYKRESGPFIIRVPGWGNYVWDAVSNTISSGSRVNISSSISTVIFNTNNFSYYDPAPAAQYGIYIPYNLGFRGTIIDSVPHSGEDLGQCLLNIPDIQLYAYEGNLATSAERWSWLQSMYGQPIKAELSIKTVDFSGGTGQENVILFFMSNLREA